MTEDLVARSDRIYRLVLKVYPRAFRDEYGDEMAQTMRDQVRDAWATRRTVGVIVVWLKVLADTAWSALVEHLKQARGFSFRRRSSDPKPLGVTLIGVFVLGFAVVCGLISVLLGLANYLIFFQPEPILRILPASVFGLIFTFLIARAGLALLANPARTRRAGTAMWLSLPVYFVALAGINLSLSMGANDVAFWGVLALPALFWIVFVVGTDLYMRSRGVRAYLDNYGRIHGGEEGPGGSGLTRSVVVFMTTTGVAVVVAIGFIVAPLRSEPDPPTFFSTNPEDLPDHAVVPDPSEVTNASQPLGGPGCEPPSSFQEWGGGLAETKASASDIEVSGLFWQTPPLTVDHEIKMLWRVTGTGDFDIEATHGDFQAEMFLGPIPLPDSSFERPGDAWGTVFVFGAPGCWEIEITRGPDNAHVWVPVES